MLSITVFLVAHSETLFRVLGVLGSEFFSSLLKLSSNNFIYDTIFVLHIPNRHIFLIEKNLLYQTHSNSKPQYLNLKTFLNTKFNLRNDLSVTGLVT